MHIVQDLRRLSLWNAWEMRNSELLYIFPHLTGHHCWINPFGQQALNIWLPIYSIVVWFPLMRIQAQVLENVSSRYWHTSLIYEKDIKTVTVFFFKLFYKFMFYVFFYDMSSPGNVPHPCSFPLNVFIWKQTAATFSLLCCQETSLEIVRCREQIHQSHQKAPAVCITWSSL